MSEVPTDIRGQQGEILVYVVDDEQIVAEVVEAVLRLHRYKIRLFDSPQLALEAFIEADPKPDLLFTDYVMEEMNGLELIEKCKRICPEVKTILYSGSVGQEIWAGRQTKPDNFLNKPFQPRVLLEMVQRLLADRPSRG